MTANPHTQPGAATATSPSPRGQTGFVLGLLLLLVMGGGGVGGVFWWQAQKKTDQRKDGPVTDDGNSGSKVEPAVCHDHEDPKFLIPLEFGEPLSVRFDRGSLDKLKDRPIPPVEIYPWLPKNLVAILGEHRMRGSLLAVQPKTDLLAVSHGGSPYIRLGPIDTLHEKAILTCPGGASMLVWSPSGEKLAVVCGDGLVRLFLMSDINKVPDPVVLDRSEYLPTSLAWSSDDKYLLGGNNSEHKAPWAAWVWNVAEKKIIKQLHHYGPVMSVAFSPVYGDYRALTGGGPGDGQLRLWNAEAGDKLKVIDFRMGPDVKVDKKTYVGEVAFSPDGKRGLSCHPDLNVRIWDLDRFEKGKEVFTLSGHAVLPTAVFSPDGKSLASLGVSGGGLTLWNAEDGKQRSRLVPPVGIHSYRFLHDSKHMAVTAADGGYPNVRLLETESGKEIQPPIGHLGPVVSVAISPDGQVLASGGSEVALRHWDLAKVEQSNVIGAYAAGVAFQLDGKRTYCWSPSYSAAVFIDPKTGKDTTPAYTMPMNERPHSGIISAALTVDGRYVVTGGYNDGLVKMWQVKDGRQVRSVDVGPGQGPAIITLCPDMRRVVRVGGTKTRLIHMRCRMVRQEWDPVLWAPFLPDGQCVLTSAAQAQVWKVKGDVPEKKEEFALSMAGAAEPRLSGDGKRVAVLLSGRVEVFDLRKGSTTLWSWEPPPHFGGVSSVGLSYDGGYLATANGDGTVYIIQVPEGPSR